MGAMSRLKVGARAACCAGAAGSVVREHAAARATNTKTTLRTRRLYKRTGGPEGPPVVFTCRTRPTGLTGERREPALETRRQVQPDVARRVDRRRVEPRAAVGDAVLIRRLICGRVVGVEQVVQIDSRVEPRTAEADD